MFYFFHYCVFFTILCRSHEICKSWERVREKEGGELSLETIVMVFDSEIPDVLAHERSCSLDPGGQLFFDGGKTEWNAGKTVFHHGAARFIRSRCRSRDLFFSPFFAALRKHFQPPSAPTTTNKTSPFIPRSFFRLFCQIVRLGPVAVRSDLDRWPAIDLYTTSY